ncbi:MAG: TonB-dependent hemoglobin/transferrin/lactoferrin family receptor, partial [Gammaproteobacteria bacterium]
LVAREAHVSRSRSPAERAPLAVLLLLGAAQAGAEAGMPELETVTVVGKLPQPLADAAAAVSVVTAAEIEALVAFELADALVREPGVSIARDPQRFGAGGVTVRGLGGNRVLVETDGVPAAKSFAIGSFSNTGRRFADLEVIRRIELLRGPASALYGSDAIAGVVSITTLNPADLLDGGTAVLRARAGYASDDGSDFAGVTGAARGGPLEGLVAYARREGGELDHAGGAPPPNPREQDSDALLARGVFNGAGWPLRLTVQWHRDRTQIDVDSLELSAGRFANTIRLEGDDRTEVVSLILDQEFGTAGPADQGRWRLYWNESAVRQFTHEERRAAPPATPPLAIEREFHYRERAAGGELTLAREVLSHAGPHRLVGGLEFTDTRVVERRDGLQTNLATGDSTSTILGEALPVRDFPISRIREAGLYLQDEWRPGDGHWSLIPALRADWYRLSPSVDAMYAADNPSEPPVSVEEASLSPKIAVGLRLSESRALYLQYAHGFRSPPFDDVNIGLDLPQFNTRAIPNPELRPERSDSLELGLRFSGASLTGSASVYASRYRDFIASRVNIGTEPGTGTTLFQSRNLARAEIVGAEAAIEADLGAWRGRLAGFTVHASAGWTDGEDTVRDRPINSIDPPRGVLGVRYDTPSGAIGAGLDVTLVGAKHDVDESAGPLYRPGGYALVDLRLRWQACERVTLHAGLFNLGDRRYHEWASVRGRSPADPMLPLYLEPGRNFAVTVSATFD